MWDAKENRRGLNKTEGKGKNRGVLFTTVLPWQEHYVCYTQGPHSHILMAGGSE